MTLATKLLINGRLVGADASLRVIDPGRGIPFISVPRGSQADATAAVDAAKKASAGWAARPIAERQKLIAAFAASLNAHADELARTLVQEQGKPLAEAQLEIVYAEFFLRHFSQATLPAEILQDDDAYRIEVHHKPLGVVAAITPWNFPVLIACYKLGPALLLGNTLVLKPAPTTPVTTLMLGALAKDIFPPGVVNVVTDNNDLGDFLTRHPDIAKISFTGSTPTGRKVMEAAAATLKRLTLELGGNDAGIVLDDVDVATVAPKIAGAAFMNAGQDCIALKRVYAHRSIYGRLCDALADVARDTVSGYGLEQGTAIGPLQNAMQSAKAGHYLEIARRDGRVLVGGGVSNSEGYFVKPTVVRDIDDTSGLVSEEQFSPIMPVVPFDDIDDVVSRANASEYGLGGSVWSADTQRACDVARRIDSGTVWVNHHLHFGPHIPFGGAKQSGIGVEFARDGLAEFAQTTVLSIAK